MGAAAPVQLCCCPTTLGGGGSPSEELGTFPCVLATARLQDIGKTHVLSCRDGGVTTPHPQGAPCAIHAWRFSFYVLRHTSSSFPYSATAAAARPAAATRPLIPAVARRIT